MILESLYMKYPYWGNTQKYINAFNHTTHSFLIIYYLAPSFDFQYTLSSGHNTRTIHVLV